jgi:hypothetical protein
VSAMQIRRVNNFMHARGDDYLRLSTKTAKNFAANASLLHRKRQITKDF